MIVQIAFASQTVEGKIAMGPRALGGEAISPFAVAMVRMLGATVFFQLFTRAAKQLRATTARDQLLLAGLSVLGIALNQTLFLVGLRLTTPMTAALLSVTIPVFAAAMAVGMGHERASGRLAVGLASSIAGVVWLTGVGRVDPGGLVVLANCVCYAAYIVFSRETIRRLGTLTVVTWVFTWGAILFAPIGLRSVVADLPGWTPRGWGFLAYILVMPTIVAYLCNAWALGRSSATLVSIYIYVQPVLAAVLAWVQLGQTVTTKWVVAGALIVVGVALVATRPDAHARARAGLDSRACPRTPRNRSSPSSSFAPSIDHASRNPFGTPKKLPAATRTPCSSPPRSIRAVRSSPRPSTAKPKSPSRGELHWRCGRAATHASTRARFPPRSPRARSASAGRRSNAATPSAAHENGACPRFERSASSPRAITSGGASIQPMRCGPSP